MTIMHDGPIEEYQVRDCTNGDNKKFMDFDAADAQFEVWKASRPDHPIMFIAVIAST